MVMSDPRSFILASWLVSIVSRNSSSLILRSLALGIIAGSLMPAIWRLRQSSSALGADGSLFYGIATSMWRLSIGLVIAIVGGIVLGILTI